MGRTVEKVESLLAEDPDFDEVFTVLMHQSDNGEGEIEWRDVREDLTSGQWGRLIQTGVLVDGEEGFVFEDPEGVRDVLLDRGLIEEIVEDAEVKAETERVEIEGDGIQWTTWDKSAAAISILMFAGYTLPSVRGIIGGTMDVLLGPINAVLPFYAVIMILALFTGLYSSLLQANLMDMDLMGAYQAQMKEIQSRQRKARRRGDDEALEKIRKEQMDAMGDQLNMFKLQFRPMVWIMVLTIPVFLWLFWMIWEGRIAEAEQIIVTPLVGEVQWRDGVVGPIEMWIVWYFVCSMAFTQIIRKALHIDMTPRTS